MRVINDIIDYLRRRRLLDSDDLCSLEGKGFIESYKVDKEDWWERREADFFTIGQSGKTNHQTATRPMPVKLMVWPKSWTSDKARGVLGAAGSERVRTCGGEIYRISAEAIFGTVSSPGRMGRWLYC
jgi:hypothetical protein